MIVTAWQLGASTRPAIRGFASGRTCSATAATSSPNPARYSVTFGQLRAARTEHRRTQRHPGGERDPWGRPLDETTVLVLATWTYAGTGYTAVTPDAQLATASAARAVEHHDQGDTAA